ncbi:hypothetical protein ALC53_03964, partial [Atta colombica]
SQNVSNLKMLLNFNQLFVLCHLSHLHAKEPAEEDTSRFSMRQCRQYHRMWKRLRSPSSSLVRTASMTHAQRKFFCSLMNQDFMRLRDSHLRNAPQKGNNLSNTLSMTVDRSLFYSVRIGEELCRDACANTLGAEIKPATRIVRDPNNLSRRNRFLRASHTCAQIDDGNQNVKSFPAIHERKSQSNLIHGVYVQLTDVKLGGDTRRPAKRQKRITIHEYLRRLIKTTSTVIYLLLMSIFT